MLSTIREYNYNVILQTFIKFNTTLVFSCEYKVNVNEKINFEGDTNLYLKIGSNWRKVVAI